MTHHNKNLSTLVKCKLGLWIASLHNQNNSRERPLFVKPLSTTINMCGSAQTQWRKTTQRTNEMRKFKKPVSIISLSRLYEMKG